MSLERGKLIAEMSQHIIRFLVKKGWSNVNNRFGKVTNRKEAAEYLRGRLKT